MIVCIGIAPKTTVFKLILFDENLWENYTLISLFWMTSA